MIRRKNPGSTPPDIEKIIDFRSPERTLRAVSRGKRVSKPIYCVIIMAFVRFLLLTDNFFVRYRFTQRRLHMKIINYKNVSVRKRIRSRRTTGIYKYAMQWKPIGDIDIRGLSNGKALNELWRCSITEDGVFDLIGKDRRGRFAKRLGVIIVTKGKVSVKDRKSALYNYMEKNRKAEARMRKFMNGR